MVLTKCRSSPRRLPYLVVVPTECRSSPRHLLPFHIGSGSDWSWRYTSESSSPSTSRLAVPLSCATPKKLEEVFWCFDGFRSQLRVGYTTKVSARVWFFCLTVWFASFIAVFFQDVRIMRVIRTSSTMISMQWACSDNDVVWKRAHSRGEEDEV